MAETIVTCEKLSKRYSIRPTTEMGWRRNRRVLAEDLAQFLNVFRGKKQDSQKVSFWALKDVSFEAHQGDVIGVIGTNGAGKSTLLKLLSRVTEPTAGRAIINGRVGSLLEVGTGFHSELTGRENIFISGSIIGMSRAEIKDKFDEIVAFSGLEKFLDTPVKRYSSGMEVRLAFSIAVHLNPELLLVDEVLSVGDASFQQKSLTKIKEVAEKGGVILLVSHNMTTIASLCTKAIVLDHGNVIYQLGSVPGAIEHYLNFAKQAQLEHKAQAKVLNQSDVVKVNDFILIDANGISIDTLTSGTPATFLIDYSIDPSVRLEQIGFTVLIKTLNGDVIANLASFADRESFMLKNHEGRVSCNIDSLPLTPGTITVSLLIEREHEVLEMIEDIFVGEVDRGGRMGDMSHHTDRKGWVDIAHEWRVV